MSNITNIKIYKVIPPSIGPTVSIRKSFVNLDIAYTLTSFGTYTIFVSVNKC